MGKHVPFPKRLNEAVLVIQANLKKGPYGHWFFVRSDHIVRYFKHEPEGAILRGLVTLGILQKIDARTDPRSEDFFRMLLPKRARGERFLLYHVREEDRLESLATEPPVSRITDWRVFVALKGHLSKRTAQGIQYHQALTVLVKAIRSSRNPSRMLLRVVQLLLNRCLYGRR